MTRPPAVRPDDRAIAEALRALFEPDCVIELRALITSPRKRTDAGYFDSEHWSALVDAAHQANECGHVYVTLNPIDPQCITRSANHMTQWIAATVTDANVTRRRWLLIDLDPKRPTGVSATDPQKSTAHARSQAVLEYLREQGWPDPVCADSGNGYHLLYRVDLPNETGVTELVKGVLRALAMRFDDEAVQVDQSVSNAGRIVKLYGTIARKGEPTAAAPHRLSRLLRVPPDLAVVTREQLAALMPPAAVKAARGQGNRSQGTRRAAAAWSSADVESFLDRGQIEVLDRGAHEGSERWRLNACPFNAEHGRTAAAVFLRPSGALAFKCLHNSCAGNDWKALRELVDGPPEARQGAWAPGSSADGGSSDELPPGAPIDAADAPAGSEEYLAREYARRYLDQVRYTPGLGWMAYDGIAWARDDGFVRNRLARELCSEYASSAIAREAKALTSCRTMSAVVNMARSTAALFVRPEAWDANTTDLNTPAGIVDLRTGVLRARVPADFVTMVTAVSPGADPPVRWLKFLREALVQEDGVTPDEQLVAHIQRFAGYLLTGSRLEKLFWFFYGDGDNGKSLLAEMLEWVLNAYAVKLPTATLMTRNNDSHPTDIASLRGKRLALSSEINQNQHFDEARLKELTGDAKVSARYMRMDYFTFLVTHKHVLTGNHRPRLHGDDPAMRSRVLLVPFHACFSGERMVRGLGAAIRAEEGPGILAWMVEGARLWHQSGLCVPPSVRDASAAYMAENDDMELWMEECCVRSPGATAGATELFKSYKAWKEARNEKAPSQTAWGLRMLKQGGVGKGRAAGVGRVTYTGIALKVPPQAEMDRYGQHRE